MSQKVSNDGDYGRCFQFWQELLHCYGENGRYEQHTTCRQQKEDYDECLHHRKLVRGNSFHSRDDYHYKLIFLAFGHYNLYVVHSYLFMIPDTETNTLAT